MRRAALLLGICGLVVAACSNDKQADPGPRPDPSVTTTLVDRSGIALLGVTGKTTTTIVTTGTASVVGAVQGPSGLVVGATVRIERLVAGQVIRNDVVTGPDGRYALVGVPGGRYRVRAFLPPSLAQVTPEVQFLSDKTEHTIDLTLKQMSGLVVRSDAAPEPPLLHRPVNVVASVSNRTVGADGVVRSTPVAGITVDLMGLGRWVLRNDGSSPEEDDTSTTTGVTLEPTTTTTIRNNRTSSISARTDSSGQVTFGLRCESTGSPGLSLRVPVTVTGPPDDQGNPGAPQNTTQTVDLDLPACIDPATTTTLAPSSTTSTTRP